MQIEIIYPGYVHLFEKQGPPKYPLGFKTFFHAQLNRTWNLIAHRNIKGENKISCFKTII